MGDSGPGTVGDSTHTIPPVSRDETRVVAMLMVEVGRCGIELALHPTDPSRLRFRRLTPNGWAADLPPDLAARLRTNKAAVLRMLAGDYAPDSECDAAYVLGERLGMAEGLGMATHAGSAAWVMAVGESMECEQ